MRKYNSQYNGNKLNTAIHYLDDSWIQVRLSGGYPGDEVVLDPGNTILLENSISQNVSTTVETYWSTSNASCVIYPYNTSVQYPCYDLFIVTCSNKANSKIYTTNSIETTSGHIYYLQVFVDGLNSMGVEHGIALESNDSILISDFTTSIDPLTLSCRGQINSSGVKVALYANHTSTAKTCEVHFGRLTLIDLTTCFGAGYEPTKEWCDTHIDMYSPDGQYHPNITLSLESEFKTLTGSFDNNGICLFKLPGFSTWMPRLSSKIYDNEFNSIVVNQVKRYDTVITGYKVNNLITNGSLSTNLNGWSTNSTTVSNLFNTPTIDNSSTKLLAKASGSYSSNAFPVYQGFRVTTNNNFQDSQILYLQAKVKGSAAANHGPIVNFGHYVNSTTTSLNYANLTDVKDLGSGWHLMSCRHSTYDSANDGSIFAWNKYNIIETQGYVLSQVDLSSDYLTVDKGFYVANTYSINPTTGKISANQNISTSSDFDNIVIGKYVVTSKNSNDQFTLKMPTSATNYTNYDYISEIYKVNTNFWQTWLGTYIYVHIYETVPGMTYGRGDTNYGTVISTNENAYPDDGIKDGYWYVKIPNFRNIENSIGFGVGQYNSSNGMVTVSNNDAMWIKDALVVNLTQNFGAGHEPSQSWCDKYININTIK